ERLQLQAEFRRLDGLIGALLGSRPSNRLSSAQALAPAQGAPYDSQRLALFEQVATQLRSFPFADIVEPAQRGSEPDMFACVGSHFSNYIEGTTFTVEEAEQIVFEGRVFVERKEDSHDIKATFEAAQRDSFYRFVPRDEQSFLLWLTQVNELVMQARPGKKPGLWKDKLNQAGNTLFTLPELVPETLAPAWPLFSTLTPPIQKALLAMVVVSETHPFSDGNGRTARLLMNCFLSEK